jgi:hypothetical protein
VRGFFGPFSSRAVFEVVEHAAEPESFTAYSGSTPPVATKDVDERLEGPRGQHYVDVFVRETRAGIRVGAEEIHCLPKSTACPMPKGRSISSGWRLNAENCGSGRRLLTR